MADWSSMNVVDPKEVQKKKRLESREKQLDSQRRKQREERMKLMMVFGAFILFIAGIAGIIWHLEARKKKSEVLSMTTYKIEAEGLGCQYYLDGLFKDIPAGGIEQRDPVRVKTGVGGKVRLVFPSGLVIGVMPGGEFDLTETNYDVATRDVFFTGTVDAGSATFECPQRTTFSVMSARLSLEQGSTAGGNFKVTRDKVNNIDEAVSQDLLINFKKAGSNDPIQVLQPSYRVKIDDKGQLTKDFVLVTGKDW